MYISPYVHLHPYVHMYITTYGYDKSMGGGVYHTPFYSRGIQEYTGIRNCGPIYSYHPPRRGEYEGGRLAGHMYICTNAYLTDF